MTPTSKAKKAQDQKSGQGFSPEERDAMKQRAAELKKEGSGGRGSKAAADEAAVLAKIAEMQEPDRSMAERLHVVVTTAAPELAPKLWYGQPAWARAGKVVCFFRSGQVDEERYSTFGFSAQADLDDEGGLWATSYALSELSEAGEATIAELVKRAVG